VKSKTAPSESLAIESEKSHGNIEIRGARVHNLKNVDVAIPKNKLVTITGLSGSGKSSLAFDTLYAEGQRRYVESLSSYARQFLGKLDKPDVDHISGISPAIAIEQKVISSNPRSTVGTVTEIYDYLKLLYARIGRTRSPISGNEVRRHVPDDVLRYVMAHPDAWWMILFRMKFKGSAPGTRDFEILHQQGYTRVTTGTEIWKIDDILNEGRVLKKGSVYVVNDRVKWDGQPETESRILDSTESAFDEGNGECFLANPESGELIAFNNRYELDGMSFEIPSVHLFSFNNPVGACKTCESFGSVIGIDPNLVFPNRSLSVFEDAIAPWKGEGMSEWKNALIMNANAFNFPIHRPIKDLKPEEERLLWTGNRYFEGIDAFFQYVQSKLYKIQYRVLYSRYRGKTLCPDCRGTRLKKEASYVKVGGASIQDLVLMPIDELLPCIQNLDLLEFDARVADRILLEIKNRLGYLLEVGLGYLTLNRAAGTLSGGESQRINLATTLGSSLVGSTYILDEPSIGLHPRDTERLIGVLHSLRNLGNTVVVVEHDEDIMHASDHLIDMGPEAGFRGGNVVYAGPFRALNNAKGSLTADYLNGTRQIEVPLKRRSWKRSLVLEGASGHNIVNATVSVPLNCLVAVTGVSGSGKSTLIRRILQPAVSEALGMGNQEKDCRWQALKGDAKHIEKLEVVDQNPIGRSSRSNPATYIDAYTDIRHLYATQPASKVYGFQAGHFSFNIDGGRCETCLGEGVIRVEMQFMADVELLCEECKGKRFKDQILEVQYQSHSVADLLNMTVDEALALFTQGKAATEKRIAARLELLAKVGLGYLKLGQGSNTLSGGEAQRIKLALFLGAGSASPKTLFIFDEPTTGLHFHDIKKLLVAFDALIEAGHSILVIEHHLDVIKCADWIIDMGPEGGKGGGNVVFEGLPEDLVKLKDNYTAKALAAKL
jgi:excinuclease ABC subunit A